MQYDRRSSWGRLALGNSSNQDQTFQDNLNGDYQGTHIPLARCRVLYLGSAVPLATAVGVEAVQNPLRERYSFGSKGDVPGIDAWLTVFSSGLLLQYVGDKSVVWFPIQTLHLCGAVKCSSEINGITGSRSTSFVALDSPAGKKSRHPPIFAAIMRRTEGVKVLECHGFICKSDQAALVLVHSCTHAFGHKEGWADDAPSGEIINSRLMNSHSVSRDKAPPEFYDKPPPQGYFYTPGRELIRTYNVFGHDTDEVVVKEDEYRHEVYRRPSAQPERILGRGLPSSRPHPPRDYYVDEPLPQPARNYYYDEPQPVFMPTQIQPMIQPEMILPPPPAPMFVETFDPYFLNQPQVPDGYFNNWDAYGGQPIVIFPADPYSGRPEYPYQGIPEYEPPPRPGPRRRSSFRPPSRRPSYYGNEPAVLEPVLIPTITPMPMIVGEAPPYPYDPYNDDYGYYGYY